MQTGFDPQKKVPAGAVKKPLSGLRKAPAGTAKQPLSELRKAPAGTAKKSPCRDCVKKLFGTRLRAEALYLFIQMFLHLSMRICSFRCAFVLSHAHLCFQMFVFYIFGCIFQF